MIKLAIVVLAAMSGSAYSMPGFTPDCPKEIKVSQTITNAYPNFRALTIPAPHYLNGIAFYLGAPEDSVNLAPDASSSASARWHFSRDDKIVMACSYHQTDIQLIQPLKAHTKNCTVSFDNTARGTNGYIPNHIQCHRY